MDYIGLGKQIRKYREDRNWTQEQLGVSVGIPTFEIERIEQGHSRIDIGVLVRIAFVLNASMDNMLRDSLSDDVSYVLPERENYIALIRKILDHLEAEGFGNRLD